MRIALVATALCVTAGLAHADAPKVPSQAPYIVLNDNHDEPSGYGFCMDTLGAGQSDLMQTHSCKPAKADEPRSYAGNDTRFEYKADTMQIESYPFEGYCMQVLIANNASAFALLECSDHPRQQFVYNDADQTLRLNEDQNSCVAVVDETEEAGPWVKRALTLQVCDETDASLKQWTIAAE
ncbi:MAG: RICIN domain-containing protein [Paracoccaceae bacterium]